MGSSKLYQGMNFGNYTECEKLDVLFPGTIVNIEINQNDKNYYKYEQCINNQDQFYRGGYKR